MIFLQISKILQEIADHFQIGRITSRKQFGGNTNENYLLTTKRGDFVCKIFLEKCLEDIEKEFSFLEYLESKNIPVSIPLSSGLEKEKRIYAKGKTIAMVCKKIDGIHPKRTIDTCKKLGIFLAQLHEVPIKTLKESQKKNFTEKSHWLMPSYLPVAIVTLRQYKNLFPREAKIMIDAYEKIKHIDITSHEQKIVHGDLYLGNVLFKNNKIIAVLDWENVGIGSALLDFARSALALSIPKTKFHPDLFRAFLAGYRAVRSFTYTNKQLADALTYTYLTRATWMLLQFGLYHPNKQKLHKYRHFFGSIRNWGNIPKSRYRWEHLYR